MRKINITTAQIIAMREATMRDNGSYELTTAKGQTINALIRAGVVVDGTRSLTVQGVSILHSVRNVDVIASKGYRTSVSDDVDSLALFTLPAPESAVVEPVDAPMGDESNDVPTVTVNGAEGFDMIPEMSALTGECYFGCGRPVTGMFSDYVGKTEGVCDFDRDKLGDHITIAPVDPSVWGGKGDNVDTVNVVQAHMGMNGMNHYHAPGCRDIVREMKRHNARKGLGMYEFPFASVAEIIEFEYADVENGDAHDMINHANDDYDGIKIMGCLSIPMGAIQGMPVLFTGGRWMLGNAPLDSERCTVCEVFGNVAENSTDVDGKHVCGYCVDNGRSFATLDTHSLVFFGETERAGIKYECTNCRSIDNRAHFAEFVCEGDESPIHNAFKDDAPKLTLMDLITPDNMSAAVEMAQETQRKAQESQDDDSDAGFVETLVTKEYELSVIVDETTGTRISLGWVTLTMNAAQCMDWDRVADEYGRTHGTGTPRHGWASIITVHDVADI